MKEQSKRIKKYSKNYQTLYSCRTIHSKCRLVSSHAKSIFREYFSEIFRLYFFLPHIYTSRYKIAWFFHIYKKKKKYTKYLKIFPFPIENSIFRLYKHGQKNENTTYSPFTLVSLSRSKITRKCMAYLRHRGHSCLDRLRERERSAQFHFTVVGIKKEEEEEKEKRKSRYGIRF